MQQHSDCATAAASCCWLVCSPHLRVRAGFFWLPAELQYLDLSANYIIGTLPSTLGNMASLRLLNLGKNGFTDLGQGKMRHRRCLSVCVGQSTAPVLQEGRSCS